MEKIYMFVISHEPDERGRVMTQINAVDVYEAIEIAESRGLDIVASLLVTPPE